MNWILIIAWAANGTGYTTQTFLSEKACQVAKQWAKTNNTRGGGFNAACIQSVSGGVK